MNETVESLMYAGHVVRRTSRDVAPQFLRCKELITCGAKRAAHAA